jgi:DNA-binding beta-propeller fold protein YncE
MGTNGGYSGNQALANGGTPTGIAVDPSGNVWVTQQNAGSPVVEFIGIAAPTITPLADAVVNNTIATKP